MLGYSQITLVILLFQTICENPYICVGLAKTFWKSFVLTLQCIDYSWYIYISTLMGVPQHCVKSVHIRRFSGPYFPAFRLNTERYAKWGKCRPEKLRNGHFLRNAIHGEIIANNEFLFPFHQYNYFQSNPVLAAHHPHIYALIFQNNNAANTAIAAFIEAI